MPEIHIEGSTFLWPGGTGGGNGSGEWVGWGQCVEEGFVLSPFYFLFFFYFWRVLLSYKGHSTIPLFFGYGTHLNPNH